MSITLRHSNLKTIYQHLHFRFIWLFIDVALSGRCILSILHLQIERLSQHCSASECTNVTHNVRSFHFYCLWHDRLKTRFAFWKCIWEFTRPMNLLVELAPIWIFFFKWMLFGVKLNSHLHFYVCNNFSVQQFLGLTWSKTCYFSFCFKWRFLKKKSWSILPVGQLVFKECISADRICILALECQWSEPKGLFYWHFRNLEHLLKHSANTHHLQAFSLYALYWIEPKGNAIKSDHLQ